MTEHDDNDQPLARVVADIEEAIQHDHLGEMQLYGLGLRQMLDAYDRDAAAQRDMPTMGVTLQALLDRIIARISDAESSELHQAAVEAVARFEEAEGEE